MDTPLPEPASFLINSAHHFPKQQHPSDPPLTALDLASGRAANGEWLAQCGFQVTAWDVSSTVIEQICQREPRRIHTAEVRDVSADPPTPNSFDVIVVCRFLDRALCPAIQAALKPRGVLFYKTFTKGLSNPDYMLGPNELLSLFEGLHVLEYHEPEPDSAGKAQASLIARADM